MKSNSALILLLSLVLLSGCTTHRHRPPHGGKLSEAMQKSSDTHKGERRIETPQGSKQPNHWFLSSLEDARSSETQTVDEGSTNAPEPPGDEGPPAQRPEQGLTFCLAGGAGLFKSDDFHPLTHFDLSIGGYISERQRLELYGGFGWARVDQSDTLESALNDGITMLSLGVRYKYFTTPQYTFLGHYLTAGAAYTEMLWRYKNEIQVDDRTIGSDAIDGLEVFAGMGLHLAQTRHFQFGLEVLPSAIFWFGYTQEGFDNDVFDNPLMLKLRITASYLP